MRPAERAIARVLAALAIVGAAALAIWLARTPPMVVRAQLNLSQFWMLELLLALVVVTSVVAMRQVLAVVAWTRRDTLIAAGEVTLAAALIFGVAPETNRIYYDEQIYESIGQNLADLHRAQMCNEGSVEYGRLRCDRAEYNKQPYAYPHLLSVGYRLFGVSDRLAHVLNGIAGSALAWVVYLLALAWFSDRRAAGLAGLVAAIIPEQALWSHTAASEPTSALAAAWAVLALAGFIRLRSTASLAWLVAASAYAMAFRPEMPLLALPVAAAILLFTPGELKQRRLWIGAGAALLLSALTIAHLASVSGERWGTSGPRLSLAFFLINLRTNGWFYVWDARFPAAVTLLAAIGIWRARSRAVTVMLAWFLAFAGIYLVFYAGSYNYGADVRYSLLTYPPLMVLAGVGAAALSRTLDARMTRAGVGVGIVVAALVGQATWYLPHTRAVGEEAWAARADVAYARAMAASLPPNAIVLTHNPGMFQVWGVNAAQMSIAADQPDYVRRDLNRRYAGGVYLHWNFWCNVSDPVQTEFCRKALSSFATDRVAEFRERDYRYALYRIRP
jgi:hypothetical protein